MDVVIILGVIEMGVVKWVDGRGDNIWVSLIWVSLNGLMDVVIILGLIEMGVWNGWWTCMIIISTCFAGLDVANWVVEKWFRMISRFGLCERVIFDVFSFYYSRLGIHGRDDNEIRCVFGCVWGGTQNPTPKIFSFILVFENFKFSFICNYIFILGLGGKLGGSRIEREYIKRIGLGASSKKFEKIPTQNFGWWVCYRFDSKSLGE